MQDVGQSEALAKQSVKCKKRAFSCEKYGLAGLGASPGWVGLGWVYLAGLGDSPGWIGLG